jgi:hypothetical protein
MIFDVYSNFAVVRYQRASKDDKPHLAFYQQKIGLMHMLWDGEKQVLVSDAEMMDATREEAAVFRAKANEEFNKRLFKGTYKPKTQVTSLEAKVSRNTTVIEVPVEASYTKPHEEEDNMEVVAASPKKPLSDFDILLAGEEDLL